MSRNEERMVAPNLQVESPGVAAQPFSMPQQTNMSWYTPSTLFVDLPSEGRFYPEGHPLHKVSSLEIRYMTGADEEILQNKDLLKKGLALDRLLSSVIIDKTVDVQAMLLGDKAAVLVAARITGFESDYGLKTSCKACGHMNEVHYDLNTVKNTKVRDEYLSGKRIPNKQGNFTVTLPKSGLEVECRLLIGFDETQLYQINESKKKNKLMETPTLDFLKRIIVSINGETDKSKIKMFVENGLTTFDSRYLKDVYKEMSPTVDMAHVFQCSKCEFYNHIDVPMTSDFFWPSVR